MEIPLPSGVTKRDRRYLMRAIRQYRFPKEKQVIYQLEIPYYLVSKDARRRLMREIRYYRFPKEEQVIQDFHLHWQEYTKPIGPYNGLQIENIRYRIEARSLIKYSNIRNMTPELSWILARQHVKPRTDGRYFRCNIFRPCDLCDSPI